MCISSPTILRKEALGIFKRADLGVLFFCFVLVAIFSGDQGSLLILCLESTPDSAQGTLRGTEDSTKLAHRRGKHLHL